MRSKQDLSKPTKSKTKPSTRSKSTKKNKVTPLEVGRIDVETKWKIEWNKQKYTAVQSSLANIQRYSICPLCKQPYSRQGDEFYVCHSDLYKNNDYYLPVCKQCIEELYENLLRQLGDHRKAYRRICQLYDIYYCDDIADAAKTFGTPHKFVLAYIHKTKMKQYVNKTYAHTIAEEEEEIRVTNAIDISRLSQTPEDSEKIEELSAFWGFCFSVQELSYLQGEYDDWANRYEITNKALEELIKHICIISLQIREAIMKGENTEKLYSQYNATLDSAALKPKQNVESTLVEQNTFGTLIKKWENEEPIPEPAEEWKDVDNIVHYISVWFLGHLCKMIGIKNHWSVMYEEEIAKYTVNRPEYSEEENVNFDDVFGAYSEEEGEQNE